MVEFDKPWGTNDTLLADSFNVYWSTAGTPGSSAGGGMQNFPATDNFPPLLRPGVTPGLSSGAAYYFSVAAVVNGAEQASSLSPVSAQTTMADPAGGVSITGTVNLSAISGLSTNTPLYLAAVSDNGFFVSGTGSVAPTASQSYTIKGLQPGTYKIYSILDMDNNGFYSINDYVGDANGKSVPVVLVPASGPASIPADIILSPKNSQVKITTTHFSNNSYALNLSVESANRKVVNAQIGTGPQIAGPIDLGPDSSGRFSLWYQVPSRPVVGDSYPVTVYYDNNTSEVINAVVTAVLDNFAATTYPVNTIPSGQFPLFSWRPPTLSGFFTYDPPRISNMGGGGDDLSHYSLSRANSNTLSVGSYSWELSVQDDHGNRATRQTYFSVSPTVTTTQLNITGFSPASGKAGDTVIITGNGFSTTPASNQVSFNGSSLAAVTAATATQLTVTLPAYTANVSSDPFSGPIRVAVGGISAVSATEFNATVGFSGTVTDKSGAAGIGGAVISMVEDPAVSTTSNADATGTYSLLNTAGVPASRPFSIRVSKSGSLDTYSPIISLGTSFTKGDYLLYSASDLGTLGITLTAGKGLIRSRVLDLTSVATGVNLAGAVVTAGSKMHPDIPYTVQYTDGAGVVNPAATATAADGYFNVLNVDEGDHVTVTPSKADMTFTPRVYATHGSAVSQGSIRGAIRPTSSAAPAGGSYSTPQTVVLSLLTGAPATIYYTTNGNDPTVSGTPYTGQFTISSTTTLKFYAKSTNFPAAAETPHSEVYNFGASISGQVTDKDSLAALPNINVQLFDQNGNFLKSINTDSSGNYILNDLQTGAYKVCFQSFSNYLAKCNFGKPYDPMNATPVPVTAPDNTVVNAKMDLGATISGKVTSNGTTGIQNVNVQPRDLNGDWISGVNGAWTGIDGTYSLLVPAGSYKIYFDGSSATPGYVSQWYNNVATSGAATQIDLLTAGAAATGINATLVQGATISGKITDSSSGANVANAQAELYSQAGNWVSSAMTDSNGNYYLRGILNGTYKVCFSPGQTNYIAKCYNNQPYNPSGATDYPPVTAPNSYTLDTTMVLGGAISGNVNNGTSGIPNIQVQVFDNVGNWINGSITDGSGNYTVRGIPAGGNAKMNFNTNGTSYVSQWYNNKTTFALSDPVSISAGATTPVNAVLELAGSISGTVVDDLTSSPLNGVPVQLYDTGGNSLAGLSTVTDASGNYSIGGLAAGQYIVRFSGGTYNAQWYNEQWFNLKTSLATAGQVTVTAGNNTGLINARLSTKTATTTTISRTSGASLSVYGDSLTFTASVTPVNVPNPAGTVTFYDGATSIGTVTVSAGSANLS
ncbi:MAG: carboxypeptidase regulatory-like domain-containing protein, partial [Syntrophales bacterium]